jgi:hypothetical protein
MTDDKMPPLPEPEAFFSVDDFGKWRESRSGTPMWTDDKVRAYARAYAAEQVRELVEGLQSAVDAWSGDGPPVVLDTLRALIAKHKGTP